MFSNSFQFAQAVRLIQAFDGEVRFPLALVAAITVPMLGLPNVLVYLRPRIWRARRLHPSGKWYKWFARSIDVDESSMLSMSRHHTSVAAAAGTVSGVEGARTISALSIVGEDADCEKQFEPVVLESEKSREELSLA